MVGVVDNIMKFELIKKVPIVEIDRKRCFLDTGFPHASMPVAHVWCDRIGVEMGLVKTNY